MRVRLLKLSNNSGKKDDLTARDILSIHLGHFEMNGKVTYSTNERIAEKTEYVILILGNIEEEVYLCHVEYHDYNKGESYIPERSVFNDYSPDKYKNKANVSWLVLNSMTKLSKEFLQNIDTKNIINTFIHDRANDKIVLLELNDIQ